MLDKEICPPTTDDLITRVHAGTEPWEIAITEYDAKVAAGETTETPYTGWETLIRSKLPEMFL